MHFIKYLAIFVILAFQFTLQEDTSSTSLENTSDAGLDGVETLFVNAQKENSQKKNLFSKFKSKTKNLKEKMNKSLNDFKNKAKKVKDQVKEKVMDTEFGQKTLNLKNQAKNQVEKLGSKLKGKFS
uniref:SXP/RAL-2 family protein Ani s 5-like cation-binding domain-containing protein n=1 Tax=Strongyloides stercoralis TaxID=6248 RepID=A0A0K0EBB0_STRER